MKLRRSRKQLDTKLPFDGFDMFLLFRLESELTLLELIDIVPRDGEETAQRVQVLARYGLVDGFVTLVGQDELVSAVVLEPDGLDDALTLRPPRKLRTSDAATLRPPTAAQVMEIFRSGEVPPEVRSLLKSTHRKVESSAQATETDDDAVRASKHGPKG